MTTKGIMRLRRMANLLDAVIEEAAEFEAGDKIEVDAHFANMGIFVWLLEIGAYSHVLRDAVAKNTTTKP